MILDTRNCEAIARVLFEGKKLPQSLDVFDRFTLPGILESVALVVEGSLSSLEDWMQMHASKAASPLGQAWRMWHRKGPPIWGEDIHGVRTSEFYRLRSRSDRTLECYQLYEERFKRSLVRENFPTNFAYALAGAFAEMTDNVIQHSEATGDAYTGLAGYHVASNYVAFGVIDIGQGVLSSLNKSPDWQHLKTSQQALRAAVCEHASSRIGQGEGEGFRTLYRQLVDRNGLMRFRTGDAILTIGDGGTHRQAVEIGTTPACGLQMSVCCSLRLPAQEKVI